MRFSLFERDHFFDAENSRVSSVPKTAIKEARAKGDENREHGIRSSSYRYGQN